MRLVFTFLTVACSIIFTANGQDPRGLIDYDEIREKSEEIVSKFTDGKMKDAFKDIRRIWILDEEQLEYLEEQSKEQVVFAETQFGERLGYTLVREDRIDGLLYRLQYVIRHEIHGIRMLFVFYKGKDNLWFLNSFTWDDSLSELFD